MLDFFIWNYWELFGLWIVNCVLSPESVRSGMVLVLYLPATLNGVDTSLIIDWWFSNMIASVWCLNDFIVCRTNGNVCDVSAGRVENQIAGLMLPVWNMMTMFVVELITGNTGNFLSSTMKNGILCQSGTVKADGVCTFPNAKTFTAVTWKKRNKRNIKIVFFRWPKIKTHFRRPMSKERLFVFVQRQRSCVHQLEHSQVLKEQSKLKMPKISLCFKFDNCVPVQMEPVIEVTTTFPMFLL